MELKQNDRGIFLYFSTVDKDQRPSTEELKKSIEDLNRLKYATLAEASWDLCLIIRAAHTIMLEKLKALLPEEVSKTDEPDE
jgi:hypothetical protein